MSFMKPEIWQESFYELDTNCGTETVSVDACGLLPEETDDKTDEQLTEEAYDHFGDYIEGDKIYSVELREGWLYRLSAPGYLDCTDTGSADTEAEAIEAVLELYGNDDGEPEDWEADLRDRLTELSRQPWEYRGIVILPADRNSSGIVWTANCNAGFTLKADSAQGIRDLIDQHL